MSGPSDPELTCSVKEAKLDGLISVTLVLLYAGLHVETVGNDRPSLSGGCQCKSATGKAALITVTAERLACPRTSKATKAAGHGQGKENQDSIILPHGVHD